MLLVDYAEHHLHNTLFFLIDQYKRLVCILFWESSLMYFIFYFLQ